MFSYLHQPKGFYKRLFLLALPVIVQNFITTSLGFWIPSWSGFSAATRCPPSR